MALVFGPSEFRQVKHWVCLSVASKLRISDAEFKPAEELRQLISSKDPHVGNALAEFLTVYDQWYQFHMDVEAAGKSGRLNAAETEQLVSLVQNRDHQREVLIKTLAAMALP